MSVEVDLERLRWIVDILHEGKITPGPCAAFDFDEAATFYAEQCAKKRDSSTNPQFPDYKWQVRERDEETGEWSVIAGPF